MRVLTPDELSRAGDIWANGLNTKDISVLMRIDESVIANHLSLIRASARHRTGKI